MFKDSNAKQIKFYKKDRDVKEEKQTQTEIFEIDYSDSYTQCLQRNEFETQTDIKEMLGTVIDNKYDIPSLEAFMKRVGYNNIGL
jgi:hypothetical protein